MPLCSGRSGAPSPGCDAGPGFGAQADPDRTQSRPAGGEAVSVESVVGKRRLLSGSNRGGDVGGGPQPRGTSPLSWYGGEIPGGHRGAARDSVSIADDPGHAPQASGVPVQAKIDGAGSAAASAPLPN